jgi:alpha-tubulin suppressor-like RCC1 family protein
VSVAGAVKTFCSIVATEYDSLAIDKYGRAWGWGRNSDGNLGDNSTISKRTPVSISGQIKTFCIISANTRHSLAIDKNGRAWGWGYNSTGQLGDSTVIRRLTPVRVAGTEKTFCAISAGLFHSLAIDKNGRAWGWGFGNNSRIGDNSIYAYTPVRVYNI